MLNEFNRSEMSNTLKYIFQVHFSYNCGSNTLKFLNSLKVQDIFFLIKQKVINSSYVYRSTLNQN